MCAFEKSVTPQKLKIVERNRHEEVKADGSPCVGFSVVVIINGASQKFNIPCPHSKKMSIETGALNRKTHYFNGTDFLCEMLKDNIASLST